MGVFTGTTPGLGFPSGKPRTVLSWTAEARVCDTAAFVRAACHGETVRPQGGTRELVYSAEEFTTSREVPFWLAADGSGDRFSSDQVGLVELVGESAP